MLKLTRREGESLKLFTSDGEITIEIEFIQGRQARVAIDAPDEVEIVSAELLDSVKKCI